jgi:hypothetical protein
MLKRTITLSSLITIFALSGCGNENQKEAASESVDGSASIEASIPKKSTFARFVPERKDDFAWENDLIAFRAYGPALRDGAENAGIDCWLKRVEYPIIDSWYKKFTEEGISYHEDHGEGLDNYHVGSSAGCGSTALWLNEKRQPLEAYTSWEILSSTANKTVFQLTYENEIEGHVYGETKKITIELGNRLYLTESTFTKDGLPAANLPLAIGLTTHDTKATPAWDKEAGWLMAWEELDGSGLGTAVKVAPGSVTSVEILENAEVKDYSHALLIVNTNDEGKVSYTAGYGWEAAGVITSPELWQGYLESSALKIGQ